MAAYPMRVVYFLQVAPDGPIKIGCTGGNIFYRIQQIQGGSPYELNWIGAFPGTHQDEKAAHRRLAEHHLRAEWFHPTPEVMAFVREKVAEGFTPDQFLDQVCMRQERNLIRTTLWAAGRSYEQLVELSGRRGFESLWWSHLSPPSSRDFVNALVAALPRLEEVPRTVRPLVKRKAT